MSWIIEIAKLLPICLGTIIVLALATLVGFAFSGKSAATGIDLLLAFSGTRLALVGALNVVIGLVLRHLTVFGDESGRWHFGLR